MPRRKPAQSHTVQFDDEVFYMDYNGRIMRAEDSFFGYARERTAPPPPPRPTREQIVRELDFKNSLTRRDIQRGIRLTTLEAVETAILVFGGVRGAAETETVRAIGETYGGMGAGMAMLAFAGRDTGSFASRVARDAMAALSVRDSWSGDWDYDGPGPFHKAGIRVSREADGMFCLTIYAAYVGSEPEMKLAARIGAPLAFVRSTLDARVDSPREGDRFRIPMTHFQCIYGALGKRWNEAEFVSKLTTPQIYEHTGAIEHYVSDVQIKLGDGITATVSLVNYTANLSPFHFKSTPERDKSVRVEDGCLTGPARLESEYDMPEPVGFEVSINVPVDAQYDAGMEKRARRYADGVESALGVLKL